MNERPALLQQRSSTHGPFRTNAQISQTLKATFKSYISEEEPLDVVHREALDMIAVKISRILSGQADFKDHWDDIAGYAQLGAEICKR